MQQLVPFQGTCYFLPLTTVSCSANCLVILKQFSYYPHTEVMLTNLSNFVGFVFWVTNMVFSPCDNWTTQCINRGSCHRGITYIDFI